MRGWRACLTISVIATLGACSSAPPKPQPAPATRPAGGAAGQPLNPDQKDSGPEASDVPADIDSVPEPVPRAEPLSRYGNPSKYTVLGKTYHVLKDVDGFKQDGIASWYGTKFHGRRTSSGEPYDMYKLTAAHKTLPLPSYVRVTNVENGKSVIVRVNDRGPFHDGRIIDLSYAAAARLDIHHGIGKVRIEVVGPGSAPAPTGAVATAAAAPAAPHTSAMMSAAPQFLQVAALSDPINVVSLRDRLGHLGFSNVQVLPAQVEGDTLHRVVLGPYRDARELQVALQTLETNGFDVRTVAQ